MRDLTGSFLPILTKLFYKALKVKVFKKKKIGTRKNVIYVWRNILIKIIHFPFSKLPDYTFILPVVNI